MVPSNLTASMVLRASRSAPGRPEAGRHAPVVTGLYYLATALREDPGIQTVRSMIGKEGPAVAIWLFPVGEEPVLRDDVR
jgi:hypothetical protein